MTDVIPPPTNTLDIEGRLKHYQGGWHWSVPIPNTMVGYSGFAFTRRGALREMRKAAQRIREKSNPEERVSL